MKPVIEQIKEQVEFIAWFHINNQVDSQVRRQVWKKVRNQIWFIRDQVWYKASVEP
jgi:hypothetical protein